jgi:thioredoxin reductase
MNQHGETSRPGFFAAGDVMSGGATVVQAIAEGCRAATSIDRYLKNT